VFGSQGWRSLPVPADRRGVLKEVPLLAWRNCLCVRRLGLIALSPQTAVADPEEKRPTGVLQYHCSRHNGYFASGAGQLAAGVLAVAPWTCDRKRVGRSGDKGSGFARRWAARRSSGGSFPGEPGRQFPF